MQKTDLVDFLIAVESTGEGTLRKIMGEEYIDTPGNYTAELHNYDGILDYLRLNMGESELTRLVEWYENNPKKVKQITVSV